MKILRRFCSEQVQILLERMDSHWAEEFALEGSKWEPMLPYGKAFEQFTPIEQQCILKTAQKQASKYNRERAYAGILERTMSPAKTRRDFDDEKHGRSEAIKGVGPVTSAAMQQQALSVLNQQLAQQYAQNAAQNLAQFEKERRAYQ